MRSFYVPLVLALATSDALAARWVPVVEGTARAIYLDSAGAVREGSQVRAWMREVYTEEQRSDQVGVHYYSANSLMSFDCGRRTWTPLLKAFYGGDGTELRRVALDAVELPALAAPGSMQENLLERACAPIAKAPAKNDTQRATVALAQPAAVSSDAKPAASAESGMTPETAASETNPKEPAATTDAQLAKRDEPAASIDTQPARPNESAASSAAQPAQPPAVNAVQPKVPNATLAAGDSVARTAQGRMRPGGAQPYVKRAAPVRVAAKQAGRPRPPTPAAARREAEALEVSPEPVEWSYAGAGGPEHWAKLKPEYAACAEGRRQSPIDIKEGARLELEPVRFDYRAAPLRIVDNGHTVQVNYAEGSSMVVAGERYELKQFHFHKPAEERIGGRRFDMVAHLVHQSLEGRLAVLAVLFEARQQPNPFLRALWPHLPLEQGREIAPSEATVDLNALLPESRTYFTYMGSLTTPPCTEGVLWVVLKTPVEMSPGQVAVFGNLHAMNARPVQPAHGRLIKESM
jgi:carbonic anhydrase